MRFTRHRGGGVKAKVDQVEVVVLSQCASQLLELVEEPELGHDPLATLVGLAPGEVERPDDPVLARLLPDAYRGDPEAASDFRRYTDAELRTAKRAAARTVLASLPEGGGTMVLDRDQCDAWLGCLNDVRLALGTVLAVTDDLDPSDLEPDDPRIEPLQVYGWLGWLQESLLSCLEPRVP